MNSQLVLGSSDGRPIKYQLVKEVNGGGRTWRVVLNELFDTAKALYDAGKPSLLMISDSTSHFIIPNTYYASTNNQLMYTMPSLATATAIEMYHFNIAPTTNSCNYFHSSGTTVQNNSDNTTTHTFGIYTYAVA